MKCTIPEISWHNRDPVLSVDLQAKNKNESFQRLATGGTDAHVVIWHIEIQQTGAASVEFAADLQRHQKAVNVVRFSPSGEFLASGDDESVIIIWKQKTDQDLPEMPTADSEGNKEQWVGVKVLRGHVEDVYDLCWSPDSTNLISGSVDNSAILWDAQKGRNLGILRDHKGFVQGVAWDPLNKYVATLSSDRTCRIYNIKTKKIVGRVSKAQLPVPESSELHGKVVRLFHDDTLKSFFRRLCFSPDGQLLIVPSGIVENANSDKHGNATHIFTRRVLSRPSALLPSNNQYTVAVRCCPMLFALRERDSVFALPYRVVLAVATQKSILLYDTQQPEPFGIVSNIHYTRLTDLTWSQDGRMLIVSSTDGYCSIITFAEGELGQPYKSNEDTSTESKDKVPAANMPAPEQDSVLRTKEVDVSDITSESPQNAKTKTQPETSTADEKHENQEKTPEKIKVSDNTDSPVTPKDRESVVSSETPTHIRSASAADSPNTLTDSPINTASPSQKTPKRIRPVLISKYTKSPRSTEQSLKKPEVHSKDVHAESSEVPKKEMSEQRKDEAPNASEPKPVSEKIQVDNVAGQKTIDTSAVTESPSRTETKCSTATTTQRTPRRVQLITLSTTVSSKTKSEIKKVTKKTTSLPLTHSISSVKESSVPEKMEMQLCDAQKQESSTTDKNSKQQQSDKQTLLENNSQKETNCLSYLTNEAEAVTECMETDQPAAVPKMEVKDVETFQKQLNESADKSFPDTKASEQKGALEQTSDKVAADSEKLESNKSIEVSSNSSLSHKKDKENTVEEPKASDKQLQGSSTPHRTFSSDLNTTPNSPLRNEVRPSSVTPGQDKRTPRRVQLVTLSSPKSKKKLL